MRQPGGGVDLAQEAVRPQGRGQFRAEDFEGDRPMVLQVLRQIHGRHAPAAELSFD